MIRKRFLAIRYACWRTPLRNGAYALLRFVGARRGKAVEKRAVLWKFLRFRDLDDHPGLRRLRHDVALAPERAHPAFERAPIEARLFLDLAVVHRRAAQHPANFPRLMRLPQHQPAVEPHGRSHFVEVASVE